MKHKLTFSLLVLFCSMSAYPHHNAASHYVLDKTITVSGVVTEFRLVNPHARIYFDLKSDTGKIEKWLAEGNSSSILRRRGWTNDSLKPGDSIEITGRPARDGSHMMDWEYVLLEDGTVLRGGNTVAGEREHQLEELEKRREAQREENEAQQEEDEE